MVSKLLEHKESESLADAEAASPKSRPESILYLHPRLLLPKGWGIGYLPQQFRDKEDGVVLANLRYAIARHSFKKQDLDVPTEPLQNVYRGPLLPDTMAQWRRAKEEHPNIITLVAAEENLITKNFKYLHQGLVNARQFEVTEKGQIKQLPQPSLIFIQGIKTLIPLFRQFVDSNKQLILEVRNGRVINHPLSPLQTTI